MGGKFNTAAGGSRILLYCMIIILSLGLEVKEELKTKSILNQSEIYKMLEIFGPVTFIIIIKL